MGWEQRVEHLTRWWKLYPAGEAVEIERSGQKDGLFKYLDGRCLGGTFFFFS